MENAGCWNPALEDRGQPIPPGTATLTATAQNQPPHAPQPLGEDVEVIDVAGFAQGLGDTTPHAALLSMALAQGDRVAEEENQWFAGKPEEYFSLAVQGV